MESPKIVIIEDEFIVAEDIKQILLSQGYAVIGMFETGEQALEQIPALEPDLLLVDIRLQGKMTGIELVESLIGQKHSIPVIYITANSEDLTYQKAKNTHPAAFLVKPFNTPTLLATVDLAFQSENSPTVKPTDDGIKSIINNSVFIRTNGKFKKLPLHDLLFVEADGSYLTLITSHHKYKLTHNLSDFQRRVSVNHFFRVHRSFIINLEKVDSFDDGFAYIGEYKIPISKNSRADFLSRLNLI